MLLRASSYIKWWKIWKTLPVSDWVKAAEAYREGNFQEAAKFYESGLKNYPEHPARFSAKLDLGFCLQKTGRLLESEALLRSVTSSSPHIKDGYTRLARVQLLMGQTLEAAWTMRRCVQRSIIDGEVVGLFLNACIENEGPHYLIQEAVDLIKKVSLEDRNNLLLKAACARLAVIKGSVERGLEELSKLADEANATPEIVIMYAQGLIHDKQISAARFQLRRVLCKRPNHPIVLALLAKSYLDSGIFFEPANAVELAVAACQASGWQSARELHLLANAYQHHGDKVAALLAASKAKDLGEKLLSNYSGTKGLENLIEQLSNQSLM